MRRRSLAIGLLAGAVWCTATADARAQGTARSTISVNVLRDGKRMNPRQVALYNATKAKTGTPTTGNTVVVETDDSDDRKRAAVYLDEFTNGDVNVLFVVAGVPMPPEVEGARRRPIGDVELRGGATYNIDVGTGTVAEAPRSLSVADGRPHSDVFRAGWLYDARVYGTGNLGRTTVISTVDFCNAVAVPLNNQGFSLTGCAFNGGSTSGSGTGGIVLRNLIGPVDVSAGVGYAGLGRTTPEFDATRQNVDVDRAVRETFTGPLLTVGAHMTIGALYVQPAVGAAWLKRKTSSTDTFRQNGQVVLTNTTTARDSDVQPYVAVEGGIKVSRFMGIGVEYSLTRFADAQKTENLHRVSGVVRVETRISRRPQPR